MPKFRMYSSDRDYPDNAIENGLPEPIGAEVIELQHPSGGASKRVSIHPDGTRKDDPFDETPLGSFPTSKE